MIPGSMARGSFPYPEDIGIGIGIAIGIAVAFPIPIPNAIGNDHRLTPPVWVSSLNAEIPRGGLESDCDPDCDPDCVTDTGRDG
jgi:hypothetical protein